LSIGEVDYGLAERLVSRLALLRLGQIKN